MFKPCNNNNNKFTDGVEQIWAEFEALSNGLAAAGLFEREGPAVQRSTGHCPVQTTLGPAPAQGVIYTFP